MKRLGLVLCLSVRHKAEVQVGEFERQEDSHGQRGCPDVQSAAVSGAAVAFQGKLVQQLPSRSHAACHQAPLHVAVGLAGAPLSFLHRCAWTEWPQWFAAASASLCSRGAAR